jgi:helix-turn-helix protein
MLPPDPPKLSSRDFDPATMADDVNMEMEVDEEESRVELSSVEINILIYLVSGSPSSSRQLHFESFGLNNHLL